MNVYMRISVAMDVYRMEACVINADLKKILEHGQNKVWTNEGRITTKVNERYIIINSMGDLKLINHLFILLSSAYVANNFLM